MAKRRASGASAAMNISAADVSALLLRCSPAQLPVPMVIKVLRALLPTTATTAEDRASASRATRHRRMATKLLQAVDEGWPFQSQGILILRRCCDPHLAADQAPAVIERMARENNIHFSRMHQLCCHRALMADPSRGPQRYYEWPVDTAFPRLFEANSMLKLRAWATTNGHTSASPTEYCFESGDMALVRADIIHELETMCSQPTGFHLFAFRTSDLPHCTERTSLPRLPIPSPPRDAKASNPESADKAAALNHNQDWARTQNKAARRSLPNRHPVHSSIIDEQGGHASGLHGHQTRELPLHHKPENGSSKLKQTATSSDRIENQSRDDMRPGSPVLSGPETSADSSAPVEKRRGRPRRRWKGDQVVLDTRGMGRDFHSGVRRILNELSADGVGSLAVRGRYLGLLEQPAQLCEDILRLPAANLQCQDRWRDVYARASNASVAAWVSSRFARGLILVVLARRLSEATGLRPSMLEDVYSRLVELLGETPSHFGPSTARKHYFYALALEQHPALAAINCGYEHIAAAWCGTLKIRAQRELHAHSANLSDLPIPLDESEGFMEATAMVMRDLPLPPFLEAARKVLRTTNTVAQESSHANPSHSHVLKRETPASLSGDPTSGADASGSNRSNKGPALLAASALLDLQRKGAANDAPSNLSATLRAASPPTSIPKAQVQEGLGDTSYSNKPPATKASDNNNTLADGELAAKVRKHLD
ncbi:uncharacterized protein MONBRDRAFT_11945 [Monosiga brevicollis MX1]|uniref:Uncharacterized protein n=1 Tax=Monosiga brevicollis TaxID=81824 RepID=A9VAR8_MONBE|nr:uncharacterized protein MONBRDRAFT_11945 [Monosiga brevicollis MX1]EDQ85423.1 predicted protein [Monosiga brevicollis MX1]|eukprot:XP_001749834.1 hypothetical protein [Monosiga brevicollis MX1]